MKQGMLYLRALSILRSVCLRSASLRTIVAYAVAASFLMASPMAVAFHNSFTLHGDRAAPMAEPDRGHSHDRNGRDKPMDHRHDRATADHGHEAGGTNAFTITGRRALPQPWHSAKLELVDLDMHYLPERPPRPETML